MNYKESFHNPYVSFISQYFALVKFPLEEPYNMDVAILHNNTLAHKSHFIFLLQILKSFDQLFEALVMGKHKMTSDTRKEDKIDEDSGKGHWV